MVSLIIRAYETLARFASMLRDIPLLVIRLVLAYGFYEPAMKKLQNFDDIIVWFGQMGIPFPTLNAYMATATELTGVVCLTLGLATRLISIPLIVVMLVAIETVHLEHGFACSGNGFEVPFYYIVMLFTLFVYGAGKASIDYLLARKMLSHEDY